MNKIVIMVLGSICAIPLSQMTYGAVFELSYLGSNAAKVSINGQDYSLGSRGKTRVDTGLNGINKISWTETLVIGQDGVIKPGNSFDPDKDRIIENDFIFEFPKEVGALNLGGEFAIFGDGVCRYLFGIDTGWNAMDGIAKKTNSRRGGW